MEKKRQTGIFLPCFRGRRLKDFPGILGVILNQDNVHYYDGVYSTPDDANYVQPADLSVLRQVHSEEMIESVRKTGYFDAALYSAGGTVQAAEAIARGTIDNAFVFTGVGDHHAGTDFFGGMCYFNGAAIAVAALRKRGFNRFAIVDTDCHHADGTRDIFIRDQDVLHICFCDQDHSDDKANVDIAIPCPTTDRDYLKKLEQAILPRLKAHEPELIFWEFGYDATRGEYGDKGLTRDCHLQIARSIQSAAGHVCRGKLIAILCGGSGRDTARCIIPKIIAFMAGMKDPESFPS